MHMATAAYSPEGARGVDALMHYLDGNRRLFDAGINAIPGLRSMPLEATYLAWVDFADAVAVDLAVTAARGAFDGGSVLAAHVGLQCCCFAAYSCTIGALQQLLCIAICSRYSVAYG